MTATFQDHSVSIKRKWLMRKFTSKDIGPCLISVGLLLTGKDYSFWNKSGPRFTRLPLLQAPLFCHKNVNKS